MSKPYLVLLAVCAACALLNVAFGQEEFTLIFGALAGFAAAGELVASTFRDGGE